ncbi:M23 family membrane bound metalloendopeptidase [Leucobacter sp. UCD-THU]|uniref:M23 family metallopeptidase n=1 Tax=Leucobacter sp. UCD-THU TaxID=1292023 RepID=UPI0003694374|nr:M23 family metallopeptidase [Leucobacter sp. UCD-THU]EYT53701.1 M23 family membrane bound metalloendopeptidase [Leucobacter sp. UCD-THU]
MTDAPILSEPRGSAGSGYPSRRSLREQQRADSQAAPQSAAREVPLETPQTAPEPTRAAAAPQAAADTVASDRPRTGPERRPTPKTAVPSTATGSLRLPFVEHVPAAEPALASAPAAPVPLRRRIAAVAASASVCGLVLTASLPLITPTDADSSAGGVVAAQELFSEVSLDELPTSFSEISASVSDSETPASYTFRPQALVNYPFVSNVMLTDGFGYRTAPVEQFHDAQDFAAPAGTPIQVIADGEVLEAGFASDGCGFGLKVEHELDGKNVTSRYCHMEMGSHAYQVGDTVAMGDQAGTVGNTGMSFGPHLHLAIRVDDEPVDPMPFFAKYTRMDRAETAPARP